MDYHWNWAGTAFTLLAEGEDPLPTLEPTTLYDNNQQDVDALIVAGNTLVLLEAKWDGDWDWVQYNAKLERLLKIDALIRRSPTLASVVDWRFVMAARRTRLTDRTKVRRLMAEPPLDRRFCFLDLEAILSPPALPFYVVTGLGEDEPLRIRIAPDWGRRMGRRPSARTLG